MRGDAEPGHEPCPFGILQKGIKDIHTCLTKCLQAGGGVSPTDTDAATTPQLCFGIDYDFATHKCYQHVSATVVQGAGPPNVLDGFADGHRCVTGLNVADPAGLSGQRQRCQHHRL